MTKASKKPPVSAEALAAQIVSLVRRSGDATFAALAMNWPDHFGLRNGGRMLSLRGRDDLVVWVGLSDTGREAMDICAAHLTLAPAHPLIYLHDGAGLSLPLAGDADKYETPHWAPVRLVLKSAADAPAKTSEKARKRRP